MKRGSVCICLTIAVLTPAIGQQPSGDAEAGRHRLLGPLGRTAPHAATEDASPSASTPKWSSSYTFTPDTALVGHSAVYDPGSQVMTIFGGDDWGVESTYTNAVLLYAPAAGSGDFTTLIPNGTAGAPPVRALHSAVYDRSTNRMIVFGGTTESEVPFGDVWVLSHANGQGGTSVWIELSPSGTPPSARYSHTAVYDSKNNRMTVFGGYGGGYFSDVWVLTNANGLGGTPAWTQLEPAGTPPTGLVYASAVYDPNNNIMMVFGGEDSGDTGYSNGVWTLSHANGLGGSPQWTNIVADGAAGSPAQRAVHSAVYDVTNNRMTIFGGVEFTGFTRNSGLNDVWVLANANGLGGTPAWTALKPTGGLPGPREAQSAVYDASTNKMIMFGGENGDAVYYVVWVLTHANGL